MKQKHIDSELYDILHFTPDASPKVHSKINDAYLQIKNHTHTAHPKFRIRKEFYLGFAASVILLLGFLGFSNPVLAGKVSFVSRIFQIIESKTGYPGNFSEYAVPIITPDASSASASNADAYSQNAGDVTITLSEASYTEMALYFSLELYSEEGFPEDFNRVQNMEDYILSYDMLSMQCKQNFEFSELDFSEEEGLPTPYRIEGNYTDAHTFLGIVRVDLETIRNILGLDTLPPEFTYSFTILRFWGDLDTYKEVSVTDPDTGEPTTYRQPVRKNYDGPWSFKIPVSLQQTDTQTREIMQTNADGIGISTVTKTRYEIKADIILPEGVDPVDYIVAITDADGKILDSQGTIMEIYSIYGRNIDTVHIYVVDYYTFMDECKAENAYRLPEKALFQTTVEW